MKRLIAVIAAACILLSGCGVIVDKNEKGRYVPASQLDTSNLEYPGSSEQLAVYFYNAASKTLTAEIRKIIIKQENPAEMAVRELLKGPLPLNEKLTSVAPGGMTLDNIEYSRDVANVYLLYDGGPIDQWQKYLLEHAISNTVTDILGTAYTCIFYNGIQTGFAGKPYNPIKKQTGNVEEAYLQASSRYEKIPPVPTGIPAEETPEPTVPVQQEPAFTEPVETEMPTVLYFISKDGGYILPEVRDVKYTEGNYIQTVVTELCKGPQNPSIMETPIAEDLVLEEEPVFEQDENGNYILTLDFSKSPARHDISDKEDSTLSYAALTYTLTNLIPGLDCINILAKGNSVSIKEGGEGADAVRRSDYFRLMGSSVPLYFADKNSDLLLQVSRSMEQGRTWSAKERLLELMKGPISGDDESAWPVMPSGVNERNIISVNVYEDIVCINLTNEFKEACEGFSSRNEMLLIYAIVNTLTAMDNVNKVQFLVEGKQTATLAGYLCLSDPFLRNYGIIKQTS